MALAAPFASLTWRRRCCKKTRLHLSVASPGSQSCRIGNVEDANAGSRSNSSARRITSKTGLRKSFASSRARSPQTFGKVERKVELRFDSHMHWERRREGKTLTVGTHLRERRCKSVSHTVTKTKLRHSPNRGSTLCLCSSRYLSLPENGPRSFAQPAQCHLCSCRALITC